MDAELKNRLRALVREALGSRKGTGRKLAVEFDKIVRAELRKNGELWPIPCGGRTPPQCMGSAARGSIGCTCR